ncbi:LLM class F420-dependent oxidoreductase [Mycolicibacter engbaekii]|uniref:LLM class F420-dependent oxidoreductase n=1 Tax=Mycolicibacter engbaekii TaxID=188915 RepID=A0A1X1TXL0_9MYCO|nr:TIGR03557 family F420-dependent LLM class oxidoreductase [Mycolicibacter engbaekii]ORV49320.1 LLM class F420-dependent oxidoreductase [Mycolicibacter engbaekii]
MTRFGYTLMTEQNGPAELVRCAVAAEEHGFDFAVCSDHFSPWLASQGHAPNAWALLGAIAHATAQLDLYSYVTCPTMRYHPAIVAQQAATVQILAEGRFTLGLGSGENLNEHIVTGPGWPNLARRQAMLTEAIKIIRELLMGETVNHDGDYFHVDQARLWDLPDIPVALAVAMSGPKGVERFAAAADHLIAVQPDRQLVHSWHAARQGTGLPGGRIVGQLPVCWDQDRDTAVQRAHRQFRWFGGGWPVNAELPTPAAFEAATRYVTPQDVAAAIPCGPDLDAIVQAVGAYREAGFTDIALIQIGGESQEAFFKEAAGPLLAALRDAAA